MIGQDQPEEGMLQLDREIKDMLAKPKAEQNWEALATRIDDYIDAEVSRVVATTWAPSRKALLRGQMLAMPSRLKTPPSKSSWNTQAREAIKKAYAIDPNDPTVQIQAIRLLAQEPDSGPAKALELLDSIVKKGKDSAAFRTLRIDLLSAIRDEKLPGAIDRCDRGDGCLPRQSKGVGLGTWPADSSNLATSLRARRWRKRQSSRRTACRSRNALFDLAAAERRPRDAPPKRRCWRSSKARTTLGTCSPR